MLCLHCIYVFCIYLRTNSDLCHLQHKLIGFYNRDEKCLQRGTDWVFKLSGLRFVLKRLTTSAVQIHNRTLVVIFMQYKYVCDKNVVKYNKYKI